MYVPTCTVVSVCWRTEKSFSSTCNSCAETALLFGGCRQEEVVLILVIRTEALKSTVYVCGSGLAVQVGI